jgi:hypothetical protein
MSICQIEERRAGRPYPRTCPTCRLGPCQRGHWKGTKPPAEKPAPTAKETMRCPEVRALVEALRPFANAVFNDNGDVTIDSSRITRHDYMRARTALAALRTAEGDQSN